MTYTELKVLVNFYLHRTDMADKLDAFFELARHRIGKDARLILLQSEADLSIVNGVAALPDDFVETKALAIPNGYPIQWQDVNNFDRFARAITAGPLAYYTIRGGSYRFAPASGTEAEPAVARVTYYKKPAKLIGLDDTNVITENYPTLYLFAVLAYAHNAIQDLASEKIANINYQSEMDKANESDAFGSSGSPSMSGL